MKFELKSLVAAAALAAAGVASAAPVTGNVGQAIRVTDPNGSGRQAELTLLNGSSGALSFSPGSGYNGTDPNTLGGLIGALNVGQVAISAVAPATYSEQKQANDVEELVRVGATANAPVVSLTADNVTGQVLSVASSGGARQLGTRISGTLTGGVADVTNLRFDLANKVVYADLIGRKDAVGTRPAVDYQLLNQALWTIGNISGPTVIPPSALLAADPKTAMEQAGYTFISKVGDLYTFRADNTISGLKVTTEGFNFFVNSLGLLSTGVNALNAVNSDVQGWGTVKSSLIFTVREVPEPSTYALMGLGLVGIALAARRRNAK